MMLRMVYVSYCMWINHTVYIHVSEEDKHYDEADDNAFLNMETDNK